MTQPPGWLEEQRAEQAVRVGLRRGRGGERPRPRNRHGLAQRVCGPALGVVPPVIPGGLHVVLLRTPLPRQRCDNLSLFPRRTRVVAGACSTPGYHGGARRRERRTGRLAAAVGDDVRLGASGCEVPSGWVTLRVQRVTTSSLEKTNFVSSQMYSSLCFLKSTQVVAKVCESSKRSWLRGERTKPRRGEFPSPSEAPHTGGHDESLDRRRSSRGICTPSRSRAVARGPGVVRVRHGGVSCLEVPRKRR